MAPRVRARAGRERWGDVALPFQAGRGGGAPWPNQARPRPSTGIGRHGESTEPCGAGSGRHLKKRAPEIESQNSVVTKVRFCRPEHGGMLGSTGHAHQPPDNTLKASGVWTCYRPAPRALRRSCWASLALALALPAATARPWPRGCRVHSASPTHPHSRGHHRAGWRSSLRRSGLHATSS